MKFHANQAELKLNGSNQFLLCADDFNLLGENMYTIKKQTNVILVAND
jgi:hypothetical protein